MLALNTPVFEEGGKTMKNNKNGANCSRKGRRNVWILLGFAGVLMIIILVVAVKFWSESWINKRPYQYYPTNVPVNELYSTIDPVNTNLPAVDYDEVTDQPMASSHINNPNWGDERQFARMVPYFDHLTAGDAVAQINLRPDTIYYLCEYLSNSCTPDTELENLKIHLNFPLKVEAGTYEPLYAYLTSDNDPVEERLCFIVMHAEEDTWLLASEETLCVKTSETDLDQAIYADTEASIMVHDYKPRATVEITWPKDAAVQGGNENAWLAYYQLKACSKDPYSQPDNAGKMEEIYRSILIMCLLLLATVLAYFINKICHKKD